MTNKDKQEANAVDEWLKEQLGDYSVSEFKKQLPALYESDEDRRKRVKKELEWHRHLYNTNAEYRAACDLRDCFEEQQRKREKLTKKYIMVNGKKCSVYAERDAKTTNILGVGEVPFVEEEKTTSQDAALDLDRLLEYLKHEGARQFEIDAIKQICKPYIKSKKRTA